MRPSGAKKCRPFAGTAQRDATRYWNSSERFPAKACPGLDPGWTPVRVKKTRQIKNPELRSDSIGSERALGRRVEVNIKSGDLAVACDDEIDTGVCGCFALRPRAPCQTSRIVQDLGRAMMRIDIMGMRRSKIAGELVQCVATDKSAGRRVQHTVFGVKFLNCGPSARGITFTENFRKIAVE